MSTSNTVKSLAKKHAELQGEIIKTAANLAELKNTLSAVEISISLFDPAYKPSQIQPKQTYKRSTTLRRGEIPKIVGNYVRESESEFQINDIVNTVCDQKDMNPEGQELVLLRQRVSRALKQLEKQGVISESGRAGCTGSPLLWTRVDP